MKKYTMKTRHALLMSLTSLTLCVSMLFGATFAWFTDSVTSGVNRIVSGNLDVELYHNSLIAGAYETANTPVTATTSDLFHAAADETAVLWEPGAMAVEQFIVKNVGSLALKYKLNLNKVEDGFYNYVTWTDDETKYDLTDVIKVAVSDTEITARDASTLTFMNWDAFVTGGMKAGTLAANDNGDGGEDEATFYVALYWAPQDNAKDNKYNLNNAADNKWTLNPTVAAAGVTGAPTLSTTELEIYPSITLLATQATSESDSFDNQYDVRADGVHTFVVAEYVPVGADDTTVTSKNDAGGTVAEVKVPQAAYEKLGIAEGDTLSLLPGEATETYDEDSVTVTGNIDLVNQNGDVIDTSTNTEPLQAKYFVGKNLGAGAKITLQLKHSDNTITTFATATAGGSGETLLTYDVNTGMVSFSSAKFCPVEVEFAKPEAKVGDTFYATLREALDVAESGDTVVLLKDVEVGDANASATGGVSIGGSIVLDGNGHTINSVAGRALWIDKSDVTVTIKNLTLNENSQKSYPRGLQVNKPNVTLTLENCNISAGHYAINVVGNCDGLNLTINGGSVVSGWAALNIWSKANITVKNSVLSGNNDKNFNVEGWNNFATVVFNTGTDASCPGSTLTCTNTKIVGATQNGNLQTLVDIRKTATDIKATFTDCEFSYQTTEKFDNYMFRFTDRTDATLTNCTFSIDGTAVSDLDELPISVYTNEALYNAKLSVNGETMLPLPTEA